MRPVLKSLCVATVAIAGLAMPITVQPFAAGSDDIVRLTDDALEARLAS